MVVIAVAVVYGILFTVLMTGIHRQHKQRMARIAALREQIDEDRRNSMAALALLRSEWRDPLTDRDEDEVDGGGGDGDPAVLQVVELDTEEGEPGSDSRPEGA